MVGFVSVNYILVVSETIPMHSEFAFQ